MSTVECAFAHARALCKRIVSTRGHGSAPFDWRKQALVSRLCPPFRRGAVLPLAVAALATAIAPARAQDYPTRPVEIIVPFAAGGGSELLARLISDGLSKRLGQPFVVLNRPGANTNLGTLAAVRSKPDGYTLLIASIGLAANPSLYKKLAFEPQSDLEPITLIANSPTVLAVPPSLPVRSLAEFIAYVKARPGELNYAAARISQPSCSRT
jgi:tripartite-type tricarboxylate transporter receptor subunit TctC